jgi:hypothetical protein
MISASRWRQPRTNFLENVIGIASRDDFMTTFFGGETPRRL